MCQRLGYRYRHLLSESLKLYILWTVLRSALLAEVSDFMRYIFNFVYCSNMKSVARDDKIKSEVCSMSEASVITYIRWGPCILTSNESVVYGLAITFLI